jgi:hypothetical protein
VPADIRPVGTNGRTQSELAPQQDGKAAAQRVRARLVRSTQLGAEALKSRGGYEVRLTVALPTIIHFTFNCLLRTPQFMYGVGDAVSEQP